ncbi:MAG: inositol monophosphatase family protein [Candidatus Poribacteria bacterium]
MLELAISAAKEAGKILLENFGKIEQVDRKGERELVSNVDLASEKKIIDMIKSKYPDHDILCEESGLQEKASDYRWVIDPMDGTHNYIYGINIFGVSIALEYKSEIILGVINLPYSNELYWAEKGKGAYFNGEKIYVSKRGIKNALAIYDSGLYKETTHRIGFLAKLVGKIFNVRVFGASTRHLTYVANGSADLQIEYGDKPWDFAAGGLLVEEAGGRITQLDGSKWNIYVESYISSNGVFHDEIIDLYRNYIEQS